MIGGLKKELQIEVHGERWFEKKVNMEDLITMVQRK